ncbi:MAG: cell division protein ZapA [Bacteroidales bacterium]|nr:cell division protein ZapA [Bacteroidales bacterium]
MDQKISIKIAGRTYNLMASSPEQEEVYRLAAEAINKRLAAYTRKNPDKTIMDLMSLVALNETVYRIGLQKELERNEKEKGELERDLDRYLQDTSTK